MRAQDEPIRSVVAYCRVSTEEQGQGYSLDEQARACAGHAARHGWTVAKTLRDESTGKNLNRPAMRQLLHEWDSPQRDWQAVLVWRLDRATRNPEDLGSLLRVMDRTNCGLLSVTEPYDGTTPAGRLMMWQLVVWAGYEREVLLERTTIGRNARVRAGLYLGGPAPLGYRRVLSSDGRHRELVIDEEGAEIVGTMARLYLEGQGYPQIGKRLGYGTTTVAQILANRVYCGWVRTPKAAPNVPRKAGEYVRGKHAPILDEATWQAIQAERKRRRGTPRGGYLLPGLVECGHCGRPMSGRTQIRRTCSTRYYRHDGHDCHIGVVRADVLEPAVVEQLKHFAAPENLRELLAEMNARATETRRVVQRKVDEAAGEVRRIERLKAELWRLVEEGHVTSQQLGERLRVHDERLAELRAMVDAAKAEASPEDPQALVRRMEEALRNLPRLLRQQDRATQAKLIRAVVRRVVVTKERGEVAATVVLYRP